MSTAVWTRHQFVGPPVPVASFYQRGGMPPGGRVWVRMGEGVFNLGQIVTRCPPSKTEGWPGYLIIRWLVFARALKWLQSSQRGLCSHSPGAGGGVLPSRSF